MSSSRKTLATGAWLAVPLVTFALGWTLRPDRQAEASPTGGASDSKHSTSPASTPTETGSGTRPPLFGGGSPATGDQALTADAISRKGRQFRDALDPIRKRELFIELIAGMTKENAEQIREQIAHLQPNDPNFRDFHYAWGKIAGADAVMFGGKTPKPDMGPALAGWASADPEAAKNWFASLDIANDPAFDVLTKDREVGADELRQHLLGGLVHGLADSDPVMAARFLHELDPAASERANALIHVVANAAFRGSSPQEAIQWSETVPEGPLRHAAVSRAAGHYAANDLAAAQQWATGYLDQPGGVGAIHAVSTHMAQRDPKAALEWVGSMPEGDARSGGFRSALATWAGKDPKAASQFLADMPASADRDHGINGLVNRHRWEDPVSALHWANEIADPQLREGTIVRAGQAYYRKQRDAAVDWLAESGFTPEVQQRITGDDRAKQ